MCVDAVQTTNCMKAVFKIYVKPRIGGCVFAFAFGKWWHRFAWMYLHYDGMCSIISVSILFSIFLLFVFSSIFIKLKNTKFRSYAVRLFSFTHVGLLCIVWNGKFWDGRICWRFKITLETVFYLVALMCLHIPYTYHMCVYFIS